METIKPKKLKKGDTIGIISLSGAVRNRENIYNAQKFFESQGFNIVFSKNIYDKKRYLSGEDELKIECLRDFFENPEIDAILCSRGGYGAIRLIKNIDYDVIKNNPKIFAGYSDVTAFSAMFLKNSGLITFSAPMAVGDFGVENVCQFSADNFFKTLTNVDSIEFKPDKVKTFYGGKADGILFGGNLSTIVSLCGQNFIPDEKFIFFAEDLNEDVYKIDKMFQQLLNIDMFLENLAGIVLGDFLDVSNEKHLEELFFEIGEKIKKPVFGGFKISHAREKITLPIGANASIDKEKLFLSPYLID